MAKNFNLYYGIYTCIGCGRTFAPRKVEGRDAEEVAYDDAVGHECPAEKE